MAIMTISVVEFKNIMKKNCSYDTYDQYCNDHFYHHEWQSFTYLEKRKLFEEYIDETDPETIIKKGYWQKAFSSKPSFDGNDVNLMC